MTLKHVMIANMLLLVALAAAPTGAQAAAILDEATLPGGDFSDTNALVLDPMVRQITGTSSNVSSSDTDLFTFTDLPAGPVAFRITINNQTNGLILIAREFDTGAPNPVFELGVNFLLWAIEPFSVVQQTATFRPTFSGGNVTTGLDFHLLFTNPPVIVDCGGPDFCGDITYTVEVIEPSAVPLPSTVALLGGGLVALGAAARRRRG